MLAANQWEAHFSVIGGLLSSIHQSSASATAGSDARAAADAEAS